MPSAAILPMGWETSALTSCLKVVRGITFPASAKSTLEGIGLIACLRTSNVQEYTEWDDLIFVPAEYCKSDAKKIKENDILISMANSYELVGKVSFVDDVPTEASFGGFISAIRGENSRFFFHLLRSSAIRASIQRTASRTVNIANISLKGLSTVMLPVPPLNEQRRIADKIDALQAKSRRARETLETVKPLLEKFRQSVLAAAFRGDLTAEWRKQNPDVEPASELLKRIPAPEQGRGGKKPTNTVIKGRAAISVNDPKTDKPEGWERVSLLRVARQETGHTPSRKHPEYWDGDIPWIGIKDAGNHHGSSIHDTYQHVTQEGLDNSSARLLPEGTVCLSRTASVGYVVVMGRAMATSQDFVTWTCSEALDPEYLMFALLAEGDHIRRFGKGSTHTTIYFPEVRALHICLAPIEEQREIVKMVKATMSKYENTVAFVASACNRLSEFDQSVLAKAFRGELVPQDPNDEPASVLLERIKAERKGK